MKHRPGGTFRLDEKQLGELYGMACCGNLWVWVAGSKTRSALPIFRLEKWLREYPGSRVVNLNGCRVFCRPARRTDIQYVSSHNRVGDNRGALFAYYYFLVGSSGAKNVIRWNVNYSD